MNISIFKPFSMSESGGRIHNEDSIYPSLEAVSVNSKLFLVCDGVGGANKGEVASAIACEAIQTYFDTFIEPESVFEADFIEKAIRYTEIRFDDYVKENLDAKGMATTLSLLYLSDDGVFVTHAGDSRLYQIRDGKIIFKTEDHSLVNSLIKNGQLDCESAQRHPQKNVIYRAIQGSNHPVEVDVVKIEDVRPKDQFFMCTDGVLESLTDDQICEVLSKDEAAEFKLIELRERCLGKSRDNFSAYLIPIQDIQETQSIKQIFASFLYAFV